MAKRLPPNTHLQLRLVKRFDGRRLVTYRNLAQPKEGAAKDHTLDLFLNERSALQAARNYCARGEKRKGPLPGEFLGVVVVKHESEGSKSARVGPWGPGKLIGRRPRVPGTTTWLYYVSPECEAFHIDPVTQEKGERVV